jgi:hypothetical protein
MFTVVKFPEGVGDCGVPTDTGIAISMLEPSMTYTRCLERDTFTLRATPQPRPAALHPAWQSPGSWQFGEQIVRLGALPCLK